MRSIQVNQINSYVNNTNELKKNTEIIKGRAPKEEIKTELNKSDTIEIKVKNNNDINARKAQDALQATKKDPSNIIVGCGDMSFWFFWSKSIMDSEEKIKNPESNGVRSPFGINGDPSCSYLGFTDKLKSFVQDTISNNSTNTYGIPKELIGFIDKYKENLLKFGCE